MTAAQAQALESLAAQKQTFAMEGLWTVFLPAIDHLRQILTGNTIGAITRVRGELAYAKTFDGNSRFFAPALGGGSLLDLGVYPIALTLSLFGSPRTVAGRWSAAPTGVDMAADVTLGYDGFQAELSVGFDRNGNNRFIIEGETGSLIIDAPFCGQADHPDAQPRCSPACGRIWLQPPVAPCRKDRPTAAPARPCRLCARLSRRWPAVRDRSGKHRDTGRPASATAHAAQRQHRSAGDHRDRPGAAAVIAALACDPACRR